MRIGHTMLIALVVAFVMPCAAAGDAEGGQPFQVVQLCDTQLGMGGYDHDVATFRLAVKHINRLAPDFVVICGDLIDKPDDAQALEDFLAIKGELTAPCHCTPGNHDIGGPVRADLLERYRARIGRDYFSFEHKGYTFVCLNTQLIKAPVEKESAAQTAWLEATLESASAKDSPVIVFGHIAPFVDRPDEPEEYFNLPPGPRAKLLALFKTHGVVAVLTGHAHRNAVREHEGIQYVASASTSKNFDGAPMGFRVWQIGPGNALEHEYVAVDGASPPAAE